MAQSFVTDAGTLIIPSAVAQIKVQQDNSGLSTTGVLLLVGEAVRGPDFSAEADLSINSFGPDQAADVAAKYGSGPLVDAFKGACAAASDENIQGSFSRAILVKTNISGRASGSLKKFDTTAYKTIEDRSYGKDGNLIAVTVTAKTSEVVPTTGLFTFLPPIASTNIDLRANGGAAQALTLSAHETPASLVSAINGLTGIVATGGTDRVMLGSPLVAGNLALTVISGNAVRVDFSVNWDTKPSIGDTLYIPAGSAIAGGSSQNCGSYVVTGSSVNSVNATKLLDASGTPAQLTAPVNVSSTPAVANTDVQAFAQVTVSIASGNPSPGLGKTLEINELTSGTGLLSTLCYTLSSGSPTAATFISKASAPKVITSASEYVANVNAARQLDAITEDLYAGGQHALAIGYKGTSGSAVVSDGVLTITVVGGAGTSPGAISLKDYKTLADLSTYINSLTGFTCSPGTAILGQQPSISLDEGTYTIGSTFGTTTGRIKQDGYRIYQNFVNNGVLVTLASQPLQGQPAPQALFFLSGGTKGGTTDASYAAAIDALELVRGNFVVPLFSRDAALDVIDGLTDASSSYTIAGIHSYTKSHVLKMSVLKRKRNRQAFLSIRDTFVNAKTASANLAHFRVSCNFQDAKDAPSGTVTQFQPWMSAVKAAATQAAGFYRSILRKGINISGALQAAGDFNDQNDSQLEDALLAGLLPIKKDENGGYYWVSDQTTYGKDSNFVYNSIQLVYAADTIALTVAQRMERAFVGQSVADVGAGLALSTLEAILDDLRRLKLIAPSDDAPKGYRNASIKIQGPAMIVSVEVKAAGSIYFIPITINVSQVTQSASG